MKFIMKIMVRNSPLQKTNTLLTIAKKLLLKSLNKINFHNPNTFSENQPWIPMTMEAKFINSIFLILSTIKNHLDLFGDMLYHTKLQRFKIHRVLLSLPKVQKNCSLIGQEGYSFGSIVILFSILYSFTKSNNVQIPWQEKLEIY